MAFGSCINFCALVELTILVMVLIMLLEDFFFFLPSQLSLRIQQKLMVGTNVRVGQQSPEVRDVRRWGYRTVLLLSCFLC